ncbi:DUF2125 domain-containing protein [uncultured Jannaschia sp.]|uniref:DUF2125 domain-containing protein n=1 Tax=uncultured Jannaschia sp. TaxID=293347 RepID=UPI0026211193|nr:DUF2125 domain-containing protein [uncultured Jannaschia sp.]
MAKWLTILAIAAALLWSGWWIVGSQAVSRGAEAGIAAARDAGWRVEYEDLSVSGFPNRFDTTVDAPDILAPSGWGVTAPFLQVFALSYRPNEVIAVAPGQLTVATPAGPVEVTSDDLRASATVTPSTTPELERATVVAEGVTVTARAGGLALARGQLASRAVGSPLRHDVALSLSDLAPDRFALSLVDPEGRLPAAIESVELDGTVELDRPLAAGAEPRLRALDLRRGDLRWGEVALDFAGRLDVDGGGLPSGVLTLEAEGWDVLLDLAVGAGLLPSDRLPLVAAVLGGMAEDGRIAVELTLREGAAFLGPIPLGPLPRLPAPML